MSILSLAEGEELARIDRADALRPYCKSVKVVPVPTRTPATRIGTHVSLKPDTVRNYFFPRGLEEARALADEGPADLVHTEFLAMAPYAERLRAPGRVTVLLEQEVASRRLRHRVLSNPLSMRTPFDLAQFLRFRRYERRIFELFDHVFVTTAREREALPAGPPGRSVKIYPNVVDTDYFRPLPGIREHPGRILFTANFRHRPNVDGLRWFAEAIAPMLRRRAPEARLTVVGADPPREVRAFARRAGIELAGRQEDLRPHLARSALFVCPVVSGGGMRGKVLEAMAMERPVVSTAIGAEGIDGASGRELVIADEPARFVEAIAGLLASEEKRRAIGRKARSLVVERYREEGVFGELEALYSTYTSGRAQR